MECKRATSLIDAYLDGELDPVHAVEVESHLQECGRCARGLESRRNLQQALRTKLPYYRAPASVRRAVEVRGARGWKWATVGLAACLMIAVGGMMLVMMRAGGESAEMRMVAAVETDHLRALLPGHLYDVESTDKHTVKPWFAGRLAYAPPVVDLKPEGFELVGGRLDVLQGETVAAMVYKRDKHYINLFVYPAAEGKKKDFVSEVVTTARGHHVVHWTCGGFECWAVSDVEGGQLRAFAEAFEKAVEG